MKLLKFSAEWCNPCKTLTQVIVKAGDKVTVPVEQIDIDTQSDIAMHYGIRSVPTLILIDDNNAEIKRRVGSMNETQLLDFLKG